MHPNKTIFFTLFWLLFLTRRRGSASRLGSESDHMGQAGCRLTFPDSALLVVPSQILLILFRRILFHLVASHFSVGICRAFFPAPSVGNISLSVKGCRGSVPSRGLLAVAFGRNLAEPIRSFPRQFADSQTGEVKAIAGARRLQVSGCRCLARMPPRCGLTFQCRTDERVMSTRQHRCHSATSSVLHVPRKGKLRWR